MKTWWERNNETVTNSKVQNKNTERGFQFPNLNSTHYSHLCNLFYPYLPQRFLESPNPIFSPFSHFSSFSKSPLCSSELGFFQFRIFRWNLRGVANSRYRCCRLRRPPPPQLAQSRFN